MSDALRSCWTMFVIAWRQDRTRLLAALVLTIGSSLAWPVVAVALRSATNAALRHDAQAALIAGALVGVGAVGVLVLRHFAYTAYVEITSAAVITLEAELMMLAGGSAYIDHHERPQYADKITVLQRELSGLMRGMGGLLAMLSLAISLSVTGVLLAGVNPWLLLLPLAAIPPALAGRRASVIVDRGNERAAADTRQSAHLFHLATDAASAKELRVFRLQGEIRRRCGTLWDRAGRTMLTAELRAASVSAAGQLFFAAAYVISVLLVVRQAVSGRSAVGDLVLVITLAAQVSQQVSAGLLEFRNLQRIAHGFTRLRWLRAVVAGPATPARPPSVPERITHGIELAGVSFRYPGTDVTILDRVDVRLAAGSTVAIVGENGAGKTTLVKLLCRFHEVSCGSITLDGVDIRNFPVEAWRRRIAAGFQDFVRLEVSAQHTVGVGDLPHLNDATAVRNALDRSQGADVLDRLEHGLATPLGKTYTDGAELSGGQWQKLALGRAMMRQTPLLLVLDEPTAALDAQAEHALFEQYARGAQRAGKQTGAITVLVSHRFSTVRMADLILVVEGGRIAEAGDHRSLLAHGGSYADLYTLQAAAYQE